jgi:hypothetical protein
MMPRLLLPSDVLENVVRDNDVEAILGIGKRRAFDAQLGCDVS